MNNINFRQLGEAVDARDFEPGWHPSKRRRIEGSHPVEDLFPQLGPEAQKYLEHIATQSFKQTVKKLARYLGIEVDDILHQYPNVNSFAAVLFDTLHKIEDIEQQHTEELEELALQIVLDLPEFQMIKQMRDQGHVSFDIKLVDNSGDIAEMLEQDAPEDQGDGIAPSEQLALYVKGYDSEEDLKREFANMMMAGNAVSKMYLFHLADDKLARFHPNLSKMYGLTSALGNLGYYMFPDMPGGVAQGGGMPAGAESIDRENHIITAKGINFPVLVHEIVKGIWEYLSADTATPGNVGGESLGDEITHLMSGPEMYRQFQAMVPEDKMYLLPLVYKKLLQERSESIMLILSGGHKGQARLDKLIELAEEEYKQFYSDE